MILMKKIESLSFSGGALKGISFCGVLKWLEMNDVVKDVKHISGTSVGAVFGLLINIGYLHKEVKSIILNLDFHRLEDFNLDNFFEDFGVADGKKIEKFIKAMIKKKGIDPDITFSKLYEITGVKLSFLCCKINDCSKVVLNYENTPDFKVSLACKISTSIPLIWKSNKIGDDYLIDGCFSRNLPIQLHEPETALGFYLISPDKNVEINSFEQYILQINACILKKGQSLELENCKALGYDVVIITNSMSIFNIDISNYEKSKAIEEGYGTCLEFFNKFQDKCQS
jgi:predicted patatin/cPLA2 family phospholipase